MVRPWGCRSPVWRCLPPRRSAVPPRTSRSFRCLNEGSETEQISKFHSGDRKLANFFIQHSQSNPLLLDNPSFVLVGKAIWKGLVFEFPILAWEKPMLKILTMFNANRVKKKDCVIITVRYISTVKNFDMMNNLSPVLSGNNRDVSNH